MEVIRTKKNILSPIPIDRVDPGWEQAFLVPPLDLPRVITRHELAIIRAQEIVVGNWYVGLHWCFKMKYWPKHAIPVKREVANSHKPLGVFIRSILELATECHALPSEDSSQYRNAAEWFHCIINEQISVSKNNVTRKTGKKSSLETEREKIKAIRGSVKSAEFEAEIFQQMAEETPHFYRLIRVARRRAAGSYNSDFWRVYMVGKGNKSMGYPHLGLLTAWGKWLKHLENPDISPFWVEGEEILTQRGKGRSISRVVQKTKPKSLAM